MPIRRTIGNLSAAAMLVLVGAHASLAQRLEPVAAFSRSTSTDSASHQLAQPDAPYRPSHPWRVAGGAIVGAPVGAFVGMLAGAMSAHIGSCVGVECSLGSALAGAAVGETVGVALGAHLGSGRRGSLVVSALTSAGIVGAGALLLRTPSRASPVIAVAIPLLQLGSMLALER